MKNLITLLLLVAMTTLYAQVGIGTNNPKAQLDIQATGGALPDGMIIPRVAGLPVGMTADQNAMLVFNTDDSKFYFWNHGATAWQSPGGLPIGVDGDILYHNGTDWVNIPKGAEDTYLRINLDGNPVWTGIEPQTPFPTVFVAGGTFSMGSTTGDADETPVHDVTLDSFYISQYEITNAQYADFMNAINAPSNGTVGVNYLHMVDTDVEIVYTAGQFVPKAGRANYPVVELTWFGAKAYSEYYGGRLPTEAEWEFAAKGGNLSMGYTYSGSNTAGNVAIYGIMNTPQHTEPIGTKAPNELDLYDMSGNVYEWCNDWYDANYYGVSPANNPAGPNSSSTTPLTRVIRGGSWLSLWWSSHYVRVTERYNNPFSAFANAPAGPSNSYPTIGFRPVFSIP